MNKQYAFDPLKGFSQITRCDWSDLHYPLTIHYHYIHGAEKPPRLLKLTLNSADEYDESKRIKLVAVSCNHAGVSYGVVEGKLYSEVKLDIEGAVAYLDQLAREDRPVLSYKSYPVAILAKGGLETISFDDWDLHFKRYHSASKEMFGEYVLKPNSERTNKIFWAGKTASLVASGYSASLAAKYVRVGRTIPMVWDTDVQRAVLSQVSHNNSIWQEINSDSAVKITAVLSDYGIAIPMQQHRRHVVYQMIYRLLDKYIDVKP